MNKVGPGDKIIQTREREGEREREREKGKRENGEKKE